MRNKATILLAVCIVASTFFSCTIANAATITLTATGVIEGVSPDNPLGGIDQMGLFGPAGSNLAGDTYSLALSFNTKDMFDQSALLGRSGFEVNLFNGNQNPSAKMTATVNGKTVSYNPIPALFPNGNSFFLNDGLHALGLGDNRLSGQVIGRGIGGFISSNPSTTDFLTSSNPFQPLNLTPAPGLNFASTFVKFSSDFSRLTLFQGPASHVTLSSNVSSLPTNLVSVSQKKAAATAASGEGIVSNLVGMTSLGLDLMDFKNVAKNDLAGVVLGVTSAVLGSEQVSGRTAEAIQNGVVDFVDLAGIGLSCTSAVTPFVGVAAADACAMEVIGFGSDIMAQLFRVIAEDPPDPNYASAFVPVVPTAPVSLTGDCQDLDAVLQRTTYSMEDSIAWLNALGVTSNRYASALSANDFFSAEMQLETFHSYLTPYNASSAATGQNLNCLATLFSASGIGTSTPSTEEESAILAAISGSGDRANFLLPYLSQLGLTSDDISSIITSYVNNPPPLPDESEVLALNQFGNDVRGTIAQTPEPPPLLMVASGLAVVSLMRQRRRKVARGESRGS